MEDCLKLSLCIPTNGIIEWVFPVLDSIYAEEVDEKEFEVVITDNGDNGEFENKIKEYQETHSNLIYKKTTAFQFLNQIEAFKIARGKLIKFVNHRMKLQKGALEYLIDFVEKNDDDKPVAYFSNGQLSISKEAVFDSFNQYVEGLSYLSSWSAGTAMWKEDFLKMDSLQKFNALFPHTNMIFCVRDKKKYVIDNTELFLPIETDESRKGTYDLFHAFAVEYPSIILELYRNGDITRKTLEKVLEQNAGFLAGLYVDYCVCKHSCSYMLDGYKDAITIFYSHRIIMFKSVFVLCKKILYKLKIIK